MEIQEPTILIVEDNNTKFRTIHRWLSSKHPGLGWMHAKTFAEARDLMNQMESTGAQFSFVISDANFPIEADAECTPIGFRLVARECADRGIPMVVCSGDEIHPGYTGDWVVWQNVDSVKQLTQYLRIGLGWDKTKKRPSARRK